MTETAMNNGDGREVLARLTGANPAISTEYAAQHSRAN